MFHERVIPNSSTPAHIIRYYMHIHILPILNREKPANHTTNNNYVRKQHGLRKVSLKLGALAQARGVLSLMLQTLA